MKSKQLQMNRRLLRIFMPTARKEVDRLFKQGKRLVHYTSAENAFAILKSKSLWLRNTNCMSDYREVEHGHQLLVQFFQTGTHRADFCAALNSSHPGIGEEVISIFDQLWTIIRTNTYVASVSEHEDNEDAHGRLSMWRAFGQQGKARAAMVMNPPQQGAAAGLRLMLMPVAYWEYVEVEREFLKIIKNINANVSFLKTVDKEFLRTSIFFILVAFAVCLKHEGFKEEKEWRVIYLPQAQRSPFIELAFEVVDGVPQPIFKVPLKEDPANDITGVGIASLINRIIIGPTMYAVPIHTTFIELLRAAGISEPEKRVSFSMIPIRS